MLNTDLNQCKVIVKEVSNNISKNFSNLWNKFASKGSYSKINKVDKED